MVDIETLATAPDACILTIAAQQFDPFDIVPYDNLRSYYCKIDTQSQADRSIEDGTVEWWSKQADAVREEAFGEEDRIPLDQALDELGRLIWQSEFLWANGPTFDMTILEHAYKSYSKSLPWKYYRVRDARTVFGLYPDLPKPPVSHHALEDCRRQIELLQTAFIQLGITQLR